MKLEKNQVLEEAYCLLDESGLDKFNMRALAKRLDVSATALYWHFSNKDELFSAMASRFYALGYGVVGNQSDWQQALKDFAYSLRDALLQYRDGARLCAIAKMTDRTPEESRRSITAPFLKMGLTEDDTLTLEAATISFVLGWCLYQQNVDARGHLQQMMDFDATFDSGLAAIVKGFECRFIGRG